MFECNYKFTLEDSIAGAKYVYKSQKRTKDKVMGIMIPVLLVIMVGLLVLDIVKGKSIVWDIVLIVALVVLELLYVTMPIMLVSSQKKSFKKQKLDEMDELQITIDNNVSVEKLIKDGEEKAKNIHSLKNLTSFIEDNERLILVFNNVEFTVIKKSALKGDLEQLKTLLKKTMSKAVNGKK